MFEDLSKNILKVEGGSAEVLARYLEPIDHICYNFDMTELKIQRKKLEMLKKRKIYCET